MKIKKIKDYIKYQPIFSAAGIEKAKAIDKPRRIMFRRTPDNIDDLTFGQLIDLWAIADDFGLYYTSASVILGLKPWLASRVRIGKAVGWMNFVSSELVRVADMWRGIEYAPTEEERAAGIGEINSGFFGVIDSYARRMGITEHDDVLKVGWMKIYACMKIDADNAKFQRRYQKQIEKKGLRK